jgi:hypothetical protein
MREAGFGGLFVVLAKVSGGVKELFGDDGGQEADFGAGIGERFDLRACLGSGGGGMVGVEVGYTIESLAGGVEGGVASGEEGSHVVRDACAGD